MKRKYIYVIICIYLDIFQYFYFYIPTCLEVRVSFRSYYEIMICNTIPTWNKFDVSLEAVNSLAYTLEDWRLEPENTGTPWKKIIWSKTSCFRFYVDLRWCKSMNILKFIVISGSINCILKFNNEFTPEKLPGPKRKGSSSNPWFFRGLFLYSWVRSGFWNYCHLGEVEIIWACTSLG